MSHLFLVVSWFGICEEEAVDSISRIRVLAPPPLPEGVLYFLPRILCLTEVIVIWNRWAPKAGFGTV